MPDPRVTIRPASAAPQGGSLALDFGACGVRAAVMAAGGIVPLDLTSLGLAPPDLLTSRPAPAGGWPSSAGLVERLGEDGVVEIEGRGMGQPYHLLRALLAELTAELRSWRKDLETLSILVSARANHLQRTRLVEASRACGWKCIRLVNKTTALAWEGLRGERAGSYLALVLGHGPAEASLVRWDGSRLRSLEHTFEPGVSGDELDRHALRRALQGAAPTHGEPVLRPDRMGSREWAWLRPRLRQLRLRLGCHPAVSLVVPAALTGGGPAELCLERAEWEKVLTPVGLALNDLVQRCCRAARTTPEQLQGCLAAGGLLLHPPVLTWLSQIFRDGRLALCPPLAEVTGACRLGAWEETPEGGQYQQSGASPPTGWQVAPGPYRIADSPGTAPAPRPPGRYSADRIIDTVRELAASGRAAEAKARLASLMTYLSALELSLADPGQALEALAALQERIEPPVGSRNEPEAPAAAEGDSGAGRRRAERRKYLLGKDYLKQAERALKEGRLTEAVQLSHKAHETSGDDRIFRAMIEVHLRAVRRRSPAPQHFAEERRWLLCARADDGASEEVQAALARRFLSHAQQLAQDSAPESRAAAIATLEELALLLPLEEQTEQWLQLLKEAPPGPVHLCP